MYESLNEVSPIGRDGFEYLSQRIGARQWDKPVVTKGDFRGGEKSGDVLVQR